jgi:hypothetical protein
VLPRYSARDRALCAKAVQSVNEFSLISVEAALLRFNSVE